MRIGELARAAGVNVQTLRFYEREGLLRPPERSASGYRCYASADLRRVRDIRGLQAVGFTLEDIRALIAHEAVLAGAEAPAAAKWSARSRILERARDRLSSLDLRLHDLARMKREMEQLIETIANADVGGGFVLPTEAVGLGRGASAPARAASAA